MVLVRLLLIRFTGSLHAKLKILPIYININFAGIFGSRSPVDVLYKAFQIMNHVNHWPPFCTSMIMLYVTNSC